MSSPLSALARYGKHLEERGDVPKTGYSTEKIHFSIVLDEVGSVVTIRDLRAGEKKPAPVMLSVPEAVSRSRNVSPNFLWDKASYVLGRMKYGPFPTEKEDEIFQKTCNFDEHYTAFRERHLKLFAETSDTGLKALALFYRKYAGNLAETAKYPIQDRIILEFFRKQCAGKDKGKDAETGNYVFELEGDGHRLISDRPAAVAMIAQKPKEEKGSLGELFCLIKGERGEVTRLHPQFSVLGGQSSGAALVSFNLNAFESWGKVQGDNAPVGGQAAEHYGKALKKLLDRDNGQSLSVGSMTLVYWAEPSPKTSSKNSLFAKMLFAGQKYVSKEPSKEAEKKKWDKERYEEARKASEIKSALVELRQGKPAPWDGTLLDPREKFYLLGISPNQARLAVTLWETSSLQRLADNVARHQEDCKIEPKPYGWPDLMPAPIYLLARTVALQEKFDNIPPRLPGELMRAVVTGAPYPSSLLTLILNRLRAGDKQYGWHQALIRGILRRKKNWKEKAPMELNTELRDPPYLLGRLFAVIEKIQRDALGKKTNATVKDRYFGAASTAPVGVFAMLLRNAQNHLAKMRKEQPGLAVTQEKYLSEICASLESFPRSLKLEEQGQFMLGYYHQRAKNFESAKTEENAETKNEEENNG